MQAAAGCTRSARCNVHDTSSAAATTHGAHNNNRDRRDLAVCRRTHTGRWWHGQETTTSFRRPELGKLNESGGEEALWLGGKPGWVGDRPDHASSSSAAAASSPWGLPCDHADQLFGRRRLSPDLVVKALCQAGQVKGAVEALELLVRADYGNGIDKRLVYAVLKECHARKDLALGAQVHALAVAAGLGADTFLCNHFIRMYAAHGKLQAAMAVFRGLAAPDAFTWSAVISAHVRQGRAERAVQLYYHMRRRRGGGGTGGTTKPDAYVLVAALRACAAAGDLQSGRQVHADVLAGGMQRHLFVCSSLVDMFAKCGSLEDARRVFDGLQDKDVVTWNAMVAGYARTEGVGQEALALYAAMMESRVAPDAVTFVCLLQACANVGAPALQVGKQLWSRLKEDRPRKLDCDVVVAGSLVNMLLKCGSLKDARLAFDQLGQQHKDVVTWNALMAGYAQQEGMGQEALSLYSAMRNEGMVVPNAVTFVCLLQACANVGVAALETGTQLHSQLRDRNLESDVVVGGSLVNMYVKCGSLKGARSVFDGLVDKNVVTWTAMIAGYAQQEGLAALEALRLHSAMQNEGIMAASVPNAVTFVCLLEACANVGVPALEKGKQLHSQIKSEGLLESHPVDMGSRLVNMYVKCGSLKDARVVFDGLAEKTVVTWNSMIAGYAQQQQQQESIMGHQEALSLFSAMPSDGVAAPNAVTFVCLLQACASVGVAALETGKRLHSQLKERGLLVEPDVVVGSSLVNMYVKCKSLKDARTVFDGLGDKKNVVTWTAMIAGYAQQEGMMGQEALNIYGSMRQEGTATPDAVTYSCLLEACASVGAVQQGTKLHAEIREAGLESNVLVGTSLVKMYAKCGCKMEVAREVFDRQPVKDLVAWTALLTGYAEHGEGSKAVRCFEELLEQGIVPDGVAYTSLLTACSHAGLVHQGQQYFDTMVERHGVQPNAQLYCCMVDLLGRSGYLARAEQMLTASGGLAGSAVSWTALLSACKSYGDAETGRRCFHRLLSLDPTVATAYVLLGGIYANAGRWDEVGRVESLRKAAGARKVPARACIEVGKEVRQFRVGEARADDVATTTTTLRQMNVRLKEGGHVPQTQLVVGASVCEQDKEDALCGHAEKLALAFGLLNTPAGSTLVVTKNLRMCSDCHSSTKVMSRMEKREIVVRDGHKVHRFQDGACSCQDRP